MKVPKKVKEIQDFKVEAETGAKSISFSQLSMYLNCPHCWYRSYVLKEAPYIPSIHTVFGTAFHETLQNWLTVLYNDSVKAANSIDLHQALLDNLKKVYTAEKAKLGRDFTTGKEITEFWEDGNAILDFIVKHRLSYFTSKGTVLVGCEIPIFYKLQDKFYFRGFIDLLTLDTDRDIWKIWDIKTSTRGWKDEKLDKIKTSQVILYREFLSKQFDIPAEKIEVEYFIVKRKIVEDAEFAAMRKRVQEFVPNSGPRITKQALGNVANFITEALDPDGNYREKDYEKKPSVKNCKWCVFKDTCVGSKAVL